MDLSSDEPCDPSPAEDAAPEQQWPSELLGHEPRC
ncbi:hypothetical protein HDE80_002604 [Rhodanobacter sp. A1T4]|nr:hypothetical protein [Rhodanobacter sp. A1T4]